jgi:hypothetical protein
MYVVARVASNPCAVDGASRVSYGWGIVYKEEIGCVRECYVSW